MEQDYLKSKEIQMSIQIDSDRNAIEKDGKLVDPETGEDLGYFLNQVK